MTSNEPLATSRVMRSVLVLSLLGAGSLSAQGATSVDPRFQPWMGCWTPSAQSVGPSVGATPKPPSLACVVPSERIRGSVDLVVFDSANVATRAAVPMPGTRVAKSVDGCEGFETATWMPDDRRLLMHAELTCGRGAKRLETGLMTMSAAGEWMQVQHLDVGGNSATTVMTLRYVADSLGEWARLGASAAPSTQSLRLAVGGPLMNRDVLEVAKRAPAALTEAWITETRQPFAVSGKELVKLADGGMPSRVIDLMVAISNPEIFAVRTAGDDRTRPMAGDVITGGIANSRMRGGCRTMSDFCYGPGGMGAWGLGWQYGLSPFDPWSLRYGYGGGLYGGGFGYGNGYYYGNRPIIIVNRGDNGSGGSVLPNQGRAVRGGGYTRSPSGGSSSPAPSIFGGSSGAGSGSSSGGSSAGSSGSGSAGGSSGGGGSGRTAKPRGSGGL